ncbi:MAG: hypothetical protein PUP91_15765 [Rhizonema sp. PD37]|nr:hypothetical protein [Rhizonema sp. PD37]
MTETQVHSVISISQFTMAAKSAGWSTPSGELRAKSWGENLLSPELRVFYTPAYCCQFRVIGSGGVISR